MDDIFHHEIIERIEIRNATFLPGQIICQGDFPESELAPWTKTGKVKRHKGQYMPPAKPLPQAKIKPVETPPTDKPTV